MTDHAWEEMLAEFRALGGTADNIRLRDGQFGRGVFPVDPGKPISIRIPENLLIDAKDAEFPNGVFRVASGSKAGMRERTFLEMYENAFSWGGGGRAEIERIFDEAQALPQELRHQFKDEFQCGDWFDEPTDTLIQQRFLSSRTLRYPGHHVIMPIIELVNHGPGPTYSANENSVALQGTFAGEVFVKYADFDPHGMFATWGFAGEQPQAFSMALGGKVGQRGVEIGRDLGGLPPALEYWIPKLAIADGNARLEFLMIGNKRHPRICKGIFYKLMRDAGFSNFEDAFETMQHANRMHFLKLIAVLEGAGGPMVDTLRRMTRFQLQAMSYCYGARAP